MTAFTCINTVFKLIMTVIQKSDEMLAATLEIHLFLLLLLRFNGTKALRVAMKKAVISNW